MILQIILADILLVARIFQNTTQLVKYPRVLSVKPSNKVYVQHNKQHHGKILLNGFHLNGHTLRFHQQTQKLEPPCSA